MWRETIPARFFRDRREISTHSLRVERDYMTGEFFADAIISTHSLRVERDIRRICTKNQSIVFQPTLSVWRETIVYAIT